jgi:hypoxanthine phosphoribosyltransferase
MTRVPQKTICTEQAIEAAVKNMARDMEAVYEKGQEVIVVGVMNGAFMFLADLVRQVNFDPRVTFIRVASYEGDKVGDAVITALGPIPVKDRHVLVVDDILDTGQTMEELRFRFAAEEPKSLRFAVMFEKPGKSKKPPNFVGIHIPDVFVVGYGLDYNGLYRGLPYLAELGT